MIDYMLRNNWHPVDTSTDLSGIKYTDKGIKFNAVSGVQATIYHMIDITGGTEIVVNLNAVQTGGKTLVQFLDVNNAILEEYHILYTGRHKIRFVVPNKDIYRNSIIKLYIGSPVGTTTVSEIFNVAVITDYNKSPYLECYSRFRFSLDEMGRTALSSTTKANSNVENITWNATDRCIDVKLCTVQAQYYTPMLLVQTSGVLADATYNKRFLISVSDLNKESNIFKIFIYDITTNALEKPTYKMWFNCIVV